MKGVTMSGWERVGTVLSEAERALEDEAALSQMMIEAARPAIDRISAIVGTGSEWQETGMTSADIGAALNKEGGIGKRVAVDIGAGPQHAFKLRFLEFGTSRNSAYPALRPGWDATQGAVSAAILEGLKRLMPMLT